MTGLYDFLVDEIFIAFLRQSPELLGEINSYEGSLRIIDNNLVFTLPALFDLTCHLFEKTHQAVLSRNRSNYLQFRKQLYNNPTNQLLRQKGGVVEIEESDKDHDTSTYRLIHTDRYNG